MEMRRIPCSRSWQPFSAAILDSQSWPTLATTPATEQKNAVFENAPEWARSETVTSLPLAPFSPRLSWNTSDSRRSPESDLMSF